MEPANGQAAGKRGHSHRSKEGPASKDGRQPRPGSHGAPSYLHRPPPQGLMEICKTRPEDPIDYLAEYLFQQNPKLD